MAEGIFFVFQTGASGCMIIVLNFIPFFIDWNKGCSVLFGFEILLHGLLMFLLKQGAIFLLMLCL